MATPTTEIWVYFEVASQSKRMDGGVELRDRRSEGSGVELHTNPLPRATSREVRRDILLKSAAEASAQPDLKHPTPAVHAGRCRCSFTLSALILNFLLSIAAITLSILGPFHQAAGTASTPPLLSSPGGAQINAAATTSVAATANQTGPAGAIGPAGPAGADGQNGTTGGRGPAGKTMM